MLPMTRATDSGGRAAVPPITFPSGSVSCQSAARRRPVEEPIHPDGESRGGCAERSPQHEHARCVRAPDQALAARRQTAVRVAPHIAQRAGKRPRVRAFFAEGLAIELGRAPRDWPAPTIESLEDLSPDHVRLLLVSHREVGCSLAVEPRELCRKVASVHGAQLHEPLIRDERAGEVLHPALHAPEPQQRAGLDGRGPIAGQRLVPGSRALEAAAELHRFERGEHLDRRRPLGGNRKVGQPAGRGDFDAIGPNPDDDGAVDRRERRRRTGDPGAQPFAGLGQSSEETGGCGIGRAFEPFARPLLVNRALLIQQAPAGPSERHRDDHRR